MEYKEFFKICTGFEARSFQENLGINEIAKEINAPTGAGKTAAILVKFLWELYSGGGHRKLLFTLPMRTLTVQVTENARKIIKNSQHLFPSGNKVMVKTLMGGDIDTDFLINADKPMIIVGVADIAINMLISCYGGSTTRDIYTGYFAHDTWIVLDETQLIPHAAATITHLQKIMENVTPPSGRSNKYTLMSATGQNSYSGNSSDLIENKKTITIMKEPQALQRIINTQNHKRIVLVNRVKEAQTLAEYFKDNSTSKVLCLHSKFIENHKKNILKEYEKSNDVILVATQVIEAGVDITSHLLATSFAPIPSIIQRAGRLGRRGEKNTQLIIFDKTIVEATKDEKALLPYDLDEIKKSIEFFKGLHQSKLTATELCQAAPTIPINSTNFKEFRKVFHQNINSYGETTATYGGVPFVRELTNDNTVTIVWNEQSLYPDKDYSIKIKNNSKVLKSPLLKVWSNGAWRDNNGAPIAKENTYLLPKNHFGYNDLTGFDDEETSTLSKNIFNKKYSQKFQNNSQNVLFYRDIVKAHEIITLDRHLEDAKQSAMKITSSWEDEKYKEIVVTAAHLHDLGKKSKLWQEYIKSKSNSVPDGLILAKSYNNINSVSLCEAKENNIVKNHSRVNAGPRHEFLTAALLLTTHEYLLKGFNNIDAMMVIWLTSAHHGHIKFTMPKTRQNETGVESILSFPVLTEVTLLSDIIEEGAGDPLFIAPGENDDGDGASIKIEELFPDFEIGNFTPPKKYSTPNFLNEIFENTPMVTLEDKILLLALSAAVRCGDWTASASYTTINKILN